MVVLLSVTFADNIKQHLTNAINAIMIYAKIVKMIVKI
jgi:hypothetical protein